MLHQYSQYYSEKITSIEDSRVEFSLQCPTLRHGDPGRPSFLISKPLIEALIDLGFTYSKMAKILGVSERTLLRRRQDFNLPIGRPFSNVTDQDLEMVIRDIVQVDIVYTTILYHGCKSYQVNKSLLHLHVHVHGPDNVSTSINSMLSLKLEREQCIPSNSIGH